MTTRQPAYLERFSETVSHYRILMQEAFEGVLAEDVSRYPVFIFHSQEVTVGIQIADREVFGGEWSVNVSTLEEFYIKGLVTIEQVDDIKRKMTGDPPRYCCLVISGAEGSLIFIDRT